MLSDKILEINGLIDEVVSNREFENFYEKAAKENNMFFDNLVNLNLLVETYLVAVKMFGFTMPDDNKKMIDNAMNYANLAFSSDKATNPVNFKKNVEMLNNKLSNSWDVFIKLDYQDLNDELTILKPLHPNPTEVTGYINQIKNHSKWTSLKQTAEIYFESKVAAEELLKDINFDDEICEFLKKVSDKKATLADLSPSILEWIKNEGISDKIYLEIK